MKSLNLNILIEDLNNKVVPVVVAPNKKISEVLEKLVNNPQLKLPTQNEEGVPITYGLWFGSENIAAENSSFAETLVQNKDSLVLRSIVVGDEKEEAPPKKKWYHKISNALIIIITILLAGAIAFFTLRTTDQKEWNKAQRLNTEIAYNQYIDKYPDGKFAEQAQIEIDWLATTKKNTIQAYTNFKKKHKKSQYAKAAIDSIQKKELIVSESSMQTLRKYIKKYPQGTYLKQATEKLKKMEADSIKDAVQAKIKKYEKLIGKWQLEAWTMDVSIWYLNLDFNSSGDLEIKCVGYDKNSEACVNPNLQISNVRFDGKILQFHTNDEVVQMHGSVFKVNSSLDGFHHSSGLSLKKIKK